MKIAPWLAVALLAAPWPGAPAAGADCPDIGKPIELVAKGKGGGRSGAKLGVFDANGKFLEEVDAALVDAGATVKACNERYGLVQISIGGQLRWVDRLEVKIRRTDAAPCQLDANRQAPDHTEPVSSGVGEPCAPAKK
jgi:hypothetical protein